MFSGTSNESSNLIGVFLHGLIGSIVTTPLCACVVLILRPKLDPSYLWFRHVTFIPFGLKLFFRLIVISSTLIHTCVMVFGYAIIGVNIILFFLDTLDRITPVNLKGSNFINIGKYVTSMRTYRQLQIINSVYNRIIWHLFPVITLIIGVVAVIMGYVVINLAGSVPYALVILGVTSIAAIFGFIQLTFPIMADMIKKSADFLMVFKLQGCSSYRKRQLRSCRHLKIWAGSYFFIHRGTRIMMLGLIADNTMSLVISV